MSRRALPVIALGCVLSGLLAGGCAQTIAGTAQATPLPTIDGTRLEQEVRETLVKDPTTAAFAATADVQCPQQVIAYPRLALFCQVIAGNIIKNVPVTVLDRDGDYQIGKPF
ncbi:hypothetical protein GCM10009836_41860 [Pseudonocardia ailaonensis]|uniref:DUF4333 domain-containing protein n=1 Tax=Pseudonocardia ailaonensis TaxID=367279 RepID=A0ABN2NAP3_9PSEU